MASSKQKLLAAFQSAVKSSMEQFPYYMQGLIGREMNVQGVTSAFRSSESDVGTEHTPNGTNTLRVQSGRLFRSFAPGNPENIFNMRISGGKITGEYGTEVPYAEIHEYGGTLSQDVTDKQKAFFWAMFYKTSEDKYKYMALAKTLNRKVKARPFFGPAIKQFNRVVLPKMQRDFELEFSKRANRLNLNP
jgi:phage gpG-like protein